MNLREKEREEGGKHGRFFLVSHTTEFVKLAFNSAFLIEVVPHNCTKAISYIDIPEHLHM